MIAVPAIVESLLFLALVLCILAVWSWGLKSSMQNRFRQKIFAIRDDMFDYAMDGGIDFNHPTYGTLRTIMNGYIRFAHTISLPLIIYTFLFQTKELKKIHQEFIKKLEQDTGSLDQQTKEKMFQYLERTGTEVLKYVLLTSPLTVLIAIPFLTLFALVAFLRGSFAKTKDSVFESIRFVNEIAFLEGKRSPAVTIQN